MLSKFRSIQVAYTTHATLLPLKHTQDYAKAFHRDLDITGKAIRAANDDLPPTSATCPDSNHGLIRDKGIDFMQRLHEVYSEVLQRLQLRISELASHFSRERLEECYSIAQSQLHRVDIAGRERVKKAVRHRQRMGATLRTFKRHESVARDAVYPANRFIYLLVALLVGVIEAYANMSFLAVGSTPWDGLVQALAFAGLNVAVSYAAGIALRGLNSPRTRTRTILVGIGYGLFICSYHLAIGHYRSALLSGEAPRQATFTAIENLWASPLGIPDLQSWMLIAVGLFFAMLALVTGYKSDDPLPGYGEADRRLVAATDGVQDAKDRYRHDVETIIETQCDAVDQRVAENRTTWKDYRQAWATASRLLERYEAESLAIETAYVAVVHDYRSTNEEIRISQAPPDFRIDPAPLRTDPMLRSPAHLRRYLGAPLDDDTPLQQERLAAVIKDRLRALGKRTIDAAEAHFTQLEQAATGESPAANERRLLEFHPPQEAPHVPA